MALTYVERIEAEVMTGVKSSHDYRLLTIDIPGWREYAARRILAYPQMRALVVSLASNLRVQLIVLNGCLPRARH